MRLNVFWRCVVFAIICFITIPFVGCSKSKQKEPFRPWLFDVQYTNGGGVAVGYAEIYDRLEMSYRSAFEDAAWRLFVDSGCRVTGNRAAGKAPGGLMSLGSYFIFDVDSSRFETFKKSLVRLDSLKMNTMVTMLVGKKGTKLESINVSSKPKNGQFIKAIAHAPGYYFNSSSWIEAERLARIEAALLLRTDFRGRQSFQNEQDLKDYLVQTDVYLSGVQTVRREFDPETGIVTVEVKVPVRK
ncbi:hypothetical protein K8I28_01485 [bacterium]|nr:hypothetical protein [bacterium]